MWISISELKCLKFKVPKVRKSYKRIKKIGKIQPIKQRGRFIPLGTYYFRHLQSGFTLLEVMIAIAIIAITLVAVFGSQSQSLSLANEAKFSTTAALLAQNKMAEFEAVNPEDLTSDSGDFGENFPDYHWKVLDYLKRIDLSIFYGEHSQYQYSLRLYRFVPKIES
ncbi:MAG: prepilin-type N-terminal cleavage/methylation domain-containing protein [Deltaproteobacteria bacterium]|nr:prepilin-type N-terminal cleavage/methylation domain-containing protein [Deltaproteobacteria bacterium]